MEKNLAASVNPEEIEKFSRMADEWWSASGKFAPLHKFNPARISYILKHAKKHFNIPETKELPLSGIKILDIGCGGGLLSEPMARLGAEVTGIDASEKNIKIASLHAEKSGLKINYICTSVEELEANSGGGKNSKFHIILNMEVIEHVADTSSFMQSACNLLDENGLMFIATLNRTFKSFAFAIVGAEYVLNWLPKGTHEWKKFLKPSEIDVMLRKNKLKLCDLSGMKYNIFKDSWATSEDIDVNYIMCAEKKI